MDLPPRRPSRPPSSPTPSASEFEPVDDFLDLPMGSEASEDAANSAADKTFQHVNSPAAEEPPIGDPVDRPMIRRRAGAPPSREARAAPVVRRKRRPSSAPGDLWLWRLLALLALGLGALLGWTLRTPPPLLTASEDLLDFDEVRLGSDPAPLRVDLLNPGDSPLSLRDVGLIGEAAEDFSFAPDGCAEGRLEAGGRCTVEILFRPSTTGPRRARLEILSNAANGWYSVPLEGVGIAPALRFEPAELQLGEAVVGYSGGDGAVRLENGGSAPLTLSRLRLDGAGASDFRTLRDGCGSRTLAPGEHCTVTYSFRPTREGERRATLRVSSDAETDGGASRLVGKGLPQEPILGLDPERLDFAPLLIGERAPKQRISLTNDGTGPLEVRRLRLSEGGAGFEILPSTCGVLRPGQSCAVEVAFAPTREGVADAFLEIVHDVGAGLHRVALVGEGTAPQAFVEPSQVVFGEVPLGDSTPSRTVRLVNSGSGPLRIDGVRLRGASTEAFDARAENCRELEPGDVCRVEVRFAPRRAGASRAELEIRHSAANGLSTISLTGVATTAEAAVEPSRIDLGEVRVGEERRGSARVLNRGRAPLTVERVELGGAASEIEVIDDRCARRQVAPGEHCTVSVRFAPTTEGRRRADLRIVHNAGAPLVVGLEAVATAAPRGALRVDVGGVDFAPVVVGAVGSAPSPVTLRNAGDGPVRLEALRLVGAHPEDFRIDGAGCGTGHVLAPGETCRVLLRFAPRAAGERSALLLIDHDGEGGALPVDLRGVGEAGAPSANQP